MCIRDRFEAPAPLFSVWGTKDEDSDVVVACGAEGLVYGWFTGSSWTKIATLTPGPNDPMDADAPHLWSVSGRAFDDFSIAAEGRLWRFQAPEAGGIAFYD